MNASWYFDFISPFAYLQSEALDRLPPGTRIDFKPVLFAGLLNHFGHKGPAEIPSKRRFTYRQVLWLARRDGIALKLPPAHPFNPLGALRLAIAMGGTAEVVHGIFRFIWAEGRRPDDPASWDELVARLCARDAADRVSEPAIKAALKANTDEAIRLGVFGVPTIAVGSELFWGYDMTAMAADYLRDPDDFEDDDMRCAGSLPEGVQRSPGGS